MVSPAAQGSSSSSSRPTAGRPPQLIYKGIDWEQGWTHIFHQGILKLEKFLVTSEPLSKREDGSLCVFTNAEYADLYSTVYRLCIQRSTGAAGLLKEAEQPSAAARLYERYGECMAKFLAEHVEKELILLRGWPLMDRICQRWQDHRTYSKWMQRIFSYLDRYYVQLAAVADLRTRGIQVFRDQAFWSVRVHLRDAVLEGVYEDREGVSIDAGGLKNVVRMYLDLSTSNYDIYRHELEDYLLPDTSKYYARKSQQWLAEHSFAEYLRLTEAALDAERVRCVRTLSERSVAQIEEVVISSLLREPLPVLLDADDGKAFMDLLSKHQLDELRRVYQLFSLVDGGLNRLCNFFKEYVGFKGCEQIQQRISEKAVAGGMKRGDSTDPMFVQDALLLHDKYKGLIASCFQVDAAFQKSLKEAFESFMNRDLGVSYSFYSLLSSFCDRLLKKSTAGGVGGKGGVAFLQMLEQGSSTYLNRPVGGGGDVVEGGRADEDIEEALCRVVELFNYLSDKDLFADHYRQALSKRLLFETSASADYERSMIAKLKLKCGSQFTNRFEGMLNDLKVARVFKDRYCEHKKTETSTGAIDFTAQVLHTGYWPAPSNSFDLSLPQQMSVCLREFEDFYANHGGQYRKLTWAHGLGNTVVASVFPSRRYDLICNPYQACLLLLYNTYNSLDLATVKRLLNIQDELYVKKIIHAFVGGKFRILQKIPPATTTTSNTTNTTTNTNTTTITTTSTATAAHAEGGSGDGSKQLCWATDKFEVNQEFTCATRLIKIAAPQQQDEHLTKERIEEDRSLAIEAAIVRLMKARKIMNHNQIVTEVFGQLAMFKPNPKMIKIGVEKLIEREFLERDSANANTYKYLA
eukprot:GHVS01085127.1.p1 GENE.GHVS01085127.1~~GHVS01085127.1.p1  ORF type:complete len:861 (-),score=151.20 GHVS01085127.1:378-2960(-)